jgi:chemotaxis protein methyltransferase CheR
MQVDAPLETAVIGDSEAELLLQVLKELTGITIPLQKKVMVAYRLRKRLSELNHPTFPEYAALVRRYPHEQQTFINLLTTNETSFFRTPRVWKYFLDEYLPEVWSKRNSDTVRIWSAAASTGEEACSIAMHCNDFQLRHPAFRYQVFASDVDTEVLKRAESGEFAARTAEKLQEASPEMYQRHFHPSGPGLYEFDSQLRQKIRFATHNLMQPPSRIPPQDIVFVRNVLIYFRPPEQEKILKNLGSAMISGAILIVGESESISALDTPFTFVQPQIYRKTG